MPRTARKEKLSDALAAANGARPTSARCPHCGVDVRIRSDRKLARHPAVGQGRGGEACAGSSLHEDSLHDVVEAAAAVLDDRLAGRRLVGGLLEVALEALDPDPANPRGEVATDASLEELAASISAVGMLQPLMVVPAGDRYTIVFGHRRAAAARIAGLSSVPVIVREDLVDATDRVLAAQLVENLQRSDLDAMAEARAFARLQDLGLTQKAIADAVGINQGTVSKRLALLKLPGDLQDHVGVNLDPSVAVELSRLEPEVASRVGMEIIDGRPAEVAIREASRVSREENLAAATVERLESLGVAVVDYPRWGHWGPDREDLPLAIQPEFPGTPPFATGPTVPIALEDHATMPCHGAAVASSAGAVVYVCLDPARHGLESPATAHERRRREEDSAMEAVAAARAAREAAAAARHSAAIAAARCRASKGDLLGYVAAWTVAAVAGPVDPAGWEPSASPGPQDALSAGELLEYDVKSCERSAWDTLVAEHGEARVAYAACLAAGERYLDYVEGSLRRGRGSAAIRLHLDRLASAGGYEMGDADRSYLLDEPVNDDGGRPEAPPALEAEEPAPPVERVRCEGSGEVIIGPKGTPAKRKAAPCATCGAEVTTDKVGRAPRHTRVA